MTGAAFGFAIHRLRKHSPKLVIPQTVLRSYWLITTIAFVMTLFVAYDKIVIFGCLFPVVVAFGRHFIGMLVGSVVAACSLQYGGWLNRLLSARLFVHVNRLTYFAYLLNPIVVVALHGASESCAHYDVAGMVILKSSHLISNNFFF